jgi:hypothetical protein
MSRDERPIAATSLARHRESTPSQGRRQRGNGLARLQEEIADLLARANDSKAPVGDVTVVLAAGKGEPIE